MRSNPHLVVSISGHGFGHLAQTAPILNRLQQLLPPLRITLRSAAPVRMIDFARRARQDARRSFHPYAR